MYLWLRKIFNLCGQSNCKDEKDIDNSYVSYSEHYCEKCKTTRCHQITVNTNKITPLDSNISECLCCGTRNN